MSYVAENRANDPTTAAAWTTVATILRGWLPGEDTQRAPAIEFPIAALLDRFEEHVRENPADHHASPIGRFVQFISDDPPRGLGYAIVRPPSPTEIAARERERSAQVAAVGVPNSPRLERVSSCDWDTWDWISARCWRICRGEARPW